MSRMIRTYIKNILQILTFPAVLLTGMASCNKILNEVPRIGAITPEEMWSNPDFVADYITQMYNYLPNWNNRDLNYSEEGSQQYLSSFFKGANSSTDGYPDINWDYGAVRTINTFFENVDKMASSIDAEELKVLKGQAYFFRAYQYYKMVKLFGGVPLVTKVLDPTANMDSLMIPRSSTLECFDFITGQLDSAIALLPPKGATGYESSRITRGAAMAIKGEVLLLKASPLFCKTTNAQYWNDAYLACSSAKSELDLEGYGLYINSSLKVNELKWYNKTEANKEMVLYVEYSNPVKTMGSIITGQRPLILSANGWGEGEPTWELVKAYPMSNGKDIGMENSGYDSSLFWKNRDPRFYCTIVYHGAPYSFSEAENRCQWIFPGLESQGYKAINGNFSGFFSRTGIDTTLSRTDFPQQAWDWPIMRYAEVLLNLAECANETGAHRAEAPALIKMIRDRAHILPGSDNSYGLDPAAGTDYQVTLDAIMKERQIEFAYEGKRFWDLRRRRMFSVFNNYGTFHAYAPYLNTAGLATIGITDYTDLNSVVNKLDSMYYHNTAGSDFNNVIKTITNFKMESIDNSGVNINIPETYYFAPLNPDWIKQSNNLKQNKGWDNGDFDPVIQ